MLLDTICDNDGTGAMAVDKDTYACIIGENQITQLEKDLKVLLPQVSCVAMEASYSSLLYICVCVCVPVLLWDQD